MAITYEPISTQTLSSAASTVTFSSIPSTYTDLVITVNAAVASSVGDLLMTFNGDTANSYSYSTVSGNGSTTASARSINRGNIPCDYNGWLTTTLSNHNCRIFVMSYANTNVNKTVLTRSSNSGTGTDANVGLWRSTAAINSIAFANNSSS